MEKQSIARNNRLDSSTIAGCITNTWEQSLSSSWNSTWNVFFRPRFERSLENKISRQRKSSEFETIRTRIQLFDVIRFQSNAIRSWHRWFSSDMPCKWRQRYHPELKGDQYTFMRFGKGIVKYNTFNQNLFCFFQPLNLKVCRSHYEFFDGECLIGAMYCML